MRQILYLDTKPFVSFAHSLFQVDAYFKKNGLIVFFPLFRNETPIFILNWN